MGHTDESGDIENDEVMIRKMNKTMIRIFTLALLMFVSMGAKADVKIEIGPNDGSGFVGGTVELKGETAPDADGKVTVTITVIPDAGYEIQKSDITVLPTVEVTPGGNTRSVTIAEPLLLIGDDPADLSLSRDYAFTLEDGMGAWVQRADFYLQAPMVDSPLVDGGVYRICFGTREKWYLWPSVTTDSNGHPYLTTFNGVYAPALNYPSKDVSYEAFDESYSLWQVKFVKNGDLTCYQLYNIGLQQYVVWSNTSGQRVVHMEAEPDDETHTWFRLDGTFPSVFITPYEAGLGTTLNSKYGDKPFLSASGIANAAMGYPNGEPDHNGDGGLMQIYEGSPMWTFELTGQYASIEFQKASEDDDEAVALHVPASDMALPAGLSAYFVTGVDVLAGVVLLQEIAYLPQGTPVLLLADGETSNFVLQPKGDDIPLLTDEEKSDNRLRIGSPAVQPKAYEDYIFFRGKFVLVSGGTLSTGKVFLDLKSEEVARSRGSLGISSDRQTTGIVSQLSHSKAVDQGWYTLTGCRLSGRPTKRGIYLHGGKKQIIK